MHLDDYGFVLSPRKDETIDLLITALMHGDEVVGIEAVNHTLQQLSTIAPPSISVGFLLCNVEAAKVEKRFLETDLNRSFLSDRTDSLELRRAQQIAPMLKKARVVLDMHQTVQPTSKPFYCISRNLETIRWAYFLEPKLNILTVPPHGFSRSGRTAAELVQTAGGIGLVVEWGQKGFSLAQAKMAANFILRSIEKLSRGEVPAVGHEIEILHINEFIGNKNEARLIAGLENFMPVKKDQLIARSSEGEIYSPQDGFIFFPKYGDLAKVSSEICGIATLEKIKI